MRKLLSAPVKWALTDADNNLYQAILKHAAELSLNLMAVKVTERPDNFLAWCEYLYQVCRDGINYDLLDPEQLVPLKKMQDLLIKGISINRIKMLRIAPWPIFFDFIQQQKTLHGLDERLRLLDFLSSLKDKPLDELATVDLHAVAGKHTADHDPEVFNFDTEWFGSTKGAKMFQLLLHEQTEQFAMALNHIPLEGEVSRQDYQNFVKAYQDIFHGFIEDKPQGETPPLFPATRLLAARRPDIFIVLTSAKVENYCLGFNLPKLNNQAFDAYWDDLLATIQVAAWWRQGQPEDELEQQLWQYRAVLVDVFLFADEDLVSQSNLIKSQKRIEKKAGQAAKSSVARKRTKETAETIVDRRLAEGDLPAYFANKRDALVAEVTKGKSLDEAIRLFRMIFG